ncbi:MAG: hypothetical protein U1F36_17045 [Planctomycetota bacterium]
MANDKGKNAFAFVKDYLTKKKGAPFAEVAEAAKAEGHKVYPIVYGRAQLLLGHVKAGKKAAKKTAVKRGPGRPPKSAAARAMPARRGPGRPPKAASGNLGGLDGLVAHVRGLERERDQLRATIEKLRGLLDNV